MRKHKKEREALQTERTLMVNAINALSRVTISQTKRYMLYRRKYIMAKQADIEEGDKIKVVEGEKEIGEEGELK